MDLIDRPISDLEFAAYNPRQMTKDQHRELTASLEGFGFVDPIIINKNPKRKNIIIGGHQRVRIWRELGNEIVPCVEVDLDEDRERELNIRLNKNVGEWDFDVLADNFEISDLMDWGFTEADLKFEVPDPFEGLTDPDEIPGHDGSPGVQRGEVWRLGDHRILCGDATIADDWSKLMGSDKASLVFSDPPYGVAYASKNRFLGKKANNIQTEIINDHLTDEETHEMWGACFKLLAGYLADPNSYYFTGPQINGLFMIPKLNEVGMEYKHQIIWVKNVPVLGRTDYLYQHEPIFFGWKGRHKFYGKGEFRSSVWHIDKNRVNDLHPTQKPVQLMENAILNSSAPGEIVVDPFLGSGSTLIAADIHKRRCFGIEIDSKYCDTTIRRWEDFTGQKATRDAKI